MCPSSTFHKFKKRLANAGFAIRYWLWWGVFFALLAYGVHRYFQHRTRELDKRLEQLNR